MDIKLRNSGIRSVSEAAVKVECPDSLLWEIEWSEEKGSTVIQALPEITTYRIFHPSMEKLLSILISCKEPRPHYELKITVFGKDMIAQTGSVEYVRDPVSITLNDLEYNT